MAGWDVAAGAGVDGGGRAGGSRRRAGGRGGRRGPAPAAGVAVASWSSPGRRRPARRGSARCSRTRRPRRTRPARRTGTSFCAAVARRGRRRRSADAAAAVASLSDFDERDAGDAVDVAQARHQRGDLGLRVGAARERDRRGGDRAADAAAGGAALGGAEVALERGDRHVGRDGAGEVAQRLLPVEARVGQVLDGLDAGVGDRLEVRVGLQRVDLLRDAGRLGGGGGQLGLAVLDRVAGQHVRGQGQHGEGEDTEHDERAGSGVLDPGGDRGSGSLGTALQVGRKQVDSSHLAWLIGTPLDRLEASRVG